MPRQEAKEHGHEDARPHRALGASRLFLLLLILAAALTLRLAGLGFGLPLGQARPDETAVAGPAVGFLSGNLDPGFFYYPAFQMYALALVYVLFYWVSKPFAGWASLAAFAESRRQSLAPFFYLSRGLSAVMGTLTVWWVYLIGRRLFDSTVGLVAALFLAFAFLHVRDSHFGVTDVPMTGLVVLAVLLIVTWQESGRLRDAALAGLAGGLAMSTKYNGLGVGVPFAVAIALRSAESRAAGRRETWRLAGAAALFGAVFALAFFATSPYTLIEWRQFVRDVSAQGSILEKGHELVLARGWYYHAAVTLPAALGWPLYLAGVAGMVGLLATRFRRSAAFLAFPLAYYVVAGNGYTVFARYMIPVLPFLAVTAAWLVVSLARAVVPAGRASFRAAALAALAAAVVAPSAVRAVEVDRLLSRTDNRVIVARALREIVEPGDTLYASGQSYGLAPLDLDGRQLDAHVWTWKEGRGFGTSDLPDWILLQRSPLALYSKVPPEVESLVREKYQLVRRFDAFEPGADRLWDPQDAFFLPLGNFTGVHRPGPNFELYHVRPEFAARDPVG